MTMNDQQSNDRIEAYLSGAMGPADQASFEQLMATDQQLAREVDRHRKAQVVINHGFNEDLKSRLTAIDEADAKQPARRRTMPIFWKIAIAASVILAIGGQFWANRAYSDTAIAENLIAMTDTQLLRGSDITSTESKFKEAELLFLAGRYRDAEQHYTDLLSEDDLLVPKAEWNLLLCYFVQGDEHGFFLTAE